MFWLNLGNYMLTFVLVLIGLAVALYPPLTISAKTAIIFLVLIIGSGSIGLGLLQTHEEDRKEEVRKAEQAKMVDQLTMQGKQITQLLELSSLPKSSPEENKKLTNVLEKLEHAIRSKKPEQIPLKTKAAHLSAEIFKFLQDNPWPTHKFSMTMETDPEKQRAEFMRETQESIDSFQRIMGAYETKFSARVAAIRNELAATGYQDPRLDNRYRFPVNFFGIRDIAQTIGALAESMPASTQ